MIEWIGSLYRGAVANLYTFLLQVSLGSYDAVFDNIYDTLYALIAIFMIFRIAISLLQYLVDPDKISDKQVGGGKLIVRIFTAVVLLLSLNSLIFPTLKRLSSALVGEGGLVNILFNNIKVTDENGNEINPGNIFNPGVAYNNENIESDNSKSNLIDNVYAASDDKDDGTCNSINVSDYSTSAEKFFKQLSGCSRSVSEKKISEFMKVYTYHNPEWNNYSTDTSRTDFTNTAFFPNNCAEGYSKNCYNIVYKEKINNKYSSSTVIGYSQIDFLNARDEISGGYSGDNASDYIDTYFLFYTGSEEVSNTTHAYSGYCKASNDRSMPICDPVNIYIESTPVTASEKFTCYYAFRDEDNKYVKDANVTGNNGATYSTCIDNLKEKIDIFSITFSKNSDEEGYKNIWESSFFIFQNSSNWSFKFNSGSGLSSINYGDYRGKRADSNAVEAMLESGQCPYINNVICSNGVCEVSSSDASHPVEFQSTEVTSIPKVLAGKNSISEVKTSANSEITSVVCPNDPANGGSGTGQTESGEAEGSNSCSWNTKHEIKIYSTDGGFTTQSVGSAQFAHNLAVAFISPGDDACEEGSSCFEKVGCFTNSYGADKKVDKLSSNGDISFDVIMALLGALITIVFLIILSLDMVVRQFKLILLQIIAPIPVLCYINPNDKIFTQWVKYYLSTYADLFIKLLGLQAAFWLAPMMIKVLSTNGISTFIIYVGAFLFAKVLPDMISKIFGLDISAGTFKDAVGIVKSGAGIAAGTAIGATIGGISGLGAGGSVGTFLGGIVGGAARGAKGGFGGHVLQGASEQRQRNVQTRNSNANGGSFWGRAKASGARFIGQQDAYEKSKGINDASTSALTQGKEFTEAAQKEMSKISELSNLGRLEVALGQAQRGEAITEDISYIGTNGEVKKLNKGASIDDARKAYSTAQKSATQMYANFLQTGKMSINGVDLTDSSDNERITAMGWDKRENGIEITKRDEKGNVVLDSNGNAMKISNPTRLQVIKDKIANINEENKSNPHSVYRTNQALLQNLDKQAGDAGLTTLYSSNIDSSNNDLQNIKQSSARDMTMNKANHDSAQQNHQ